MERTALIALSKAARRARALARADRGHRVVLDEPFFVGVFRETFRWEGRDLPILPVDTELLSIDNARRLVLKAGTRPYSDGASLCPDKLLGVDLAPGYLPHDAFYEMFEDILADPAWKAAGWTEPALRKLADIVLGRMVARPVPERPEGEAPSSPSPRRAFVSRLCYGAVRRFGGLYHALARAFVLVLMAGLCAGLLGCSGGCMAVPDGVFDPSDEVPVYHVEPLGD